MSASELELSKLLFDNQDKIDLISWNDYIAYTESLNQTEFDSNLRLVIFKEIVLEKNIFNYVIDGYLLKNDY